MKPLIGINEEALARVAVILNDFLADELSLYVKTRNAHWNVEGSDFHALHKFFEDQYEQLDEIIDNVAERIRALGHYALAPMKAYGDEVRAADQTGMKKDSFAWLTAILIDHEMIIRKLREHINPVSNDLGDAGTSDFITGLLVAHEKMAWMLRAHCTLSSHLFQVNNDKQADI